MRFCQILFGAARVVRSSGSRLGGSKGRQAISLTQAAVSRIKELIQQKPGAKALKVIWYLFSSPPPSSQFFRKLCKNGQYEQQL